MAEPRAVPPISEDLDPTTIACLLHLAGALRTGDEAAADRARRTLLVWLGDPDVVLWAAAALIDPDTPVDRWWDNPGRPCARCRRPLPSTANRQQRYHALCHEEHRRDMWRRRDQATPKPTPDEES